MKVHYYKGFDKSFLQLPQHIQKKTKRQVKQLSENPMHPSLRTRKIQGTPDLWEARVDIHYRMSFEMDKDTIYLRLVGNHDEVLKNP